MGGAGSLLEVGPAFSESQNSRRLSAEPRISNCPAFVEASAGRLSRRLSLCVMNTGFIHCEPSNVTTNSVYTVPIGVHQTGCWLRKASQIRPEASTNRRGIVFRGFC